MLPVFLDFWIPEVLIELEDLLQSYECKPNMCTDEESPFRSMSWLQRDIEVDCILRIHLIEETEYSAHTLLFLVDQKWIESLIREKYTILHYWIITRKNR